MRVKSLSRMGSPNAAKTLASVAASLLVNVDVLCGEQHAAMAARREVCVILITVNITNNHCFHKLRSLYVTSPTRAQRR